MVVEQMVIGIVFGIVFGLAGYFSSRDWESTTGFEAFSLVKLGRTVVIYAAAGALVGSMGDPLTQENIVAATGSTVALGEIAERFLKAVVKQRRASRRGR